MRKALAPLLISLGSLLLALGLGEVGARIIIPASQEAKATKVRERPKLFFMPKHSPTLQDQAYSRAKPEGVFRIAVIGDSFSFAPQMQYDDSFSKRLERFLNLNSASSATDTNSDAQSIPGAMPVGSETLTAQVLNFGTPGFSTLHEVTTLDEALRYSPDLILLQITLNDAQLRPFKMEPIEVQRKFGKVPLDVEGSWFLRNSRLVRWVAERIHNQQSVNAYIQYHYDLFSNPESGGTFRSALDQIRARVAEAASKQQEKHTPRLAAVVFPLFDFPLNDNYPFLALHQTIGALLKERNIPTLDLAQRFKGIPVERLQLIPGKDSHPNEIAHRIAAEQILTWLVKRRFVPASFAPERVFKRRDHVKEPAISAPFASRPNKGAPNNPTQCANSL